MNAVVSGKSPQIFSPSFPVEYVTAFSGRTDAPQVRCDLTDRQTDTQNNYSNPRCACAPRVNKADSNQRLVWADYENCLFACRNTAVVCGKLAFIVLAVILALKPLGTSFSLSE